MTKKRAPKRKHPIERTKRVEEHYAEVLEPEDDSGELIEQVLTHAAGLLVSGTALYRAKRRRALRPGGAE